MLAAPKYAFTPIDVNSGLSGNQVRNIAQLPDGRMAIITQGLINIYDGARFEYLHYNENNSVKLSGYKGFHHVYMGANGYMWLKNYHQLFIIDVKHERFAPSPQQVLRSMGVTFSISDIFMDIAHRLWLVSDNDDLYLLPEGKDRPQLFHKKITSLAGKDDQVYDVAVLDNKLFLFYRSGIMICFDLRTGKEVYRQQSLTDEQREKYAQTSFVIPAEHQLYQLRNGVGGGTMLSYDLAKRKWNTVMQAQKWLNYLSVEQNGGIWVSGAEGMWKIDRTLGDREFIPQLRLVDGQVITTEVSTIFHDDQGGMWLGTINRGLLYYHPDRFKFKNVGKTLFQIDPGATINVSGFAQVDGQHVLVGTLQGLYLYNSVTGAMERLQAGNGSVCLSLMPDKKGGVWIGTERDGLIYMDARRALHRYPSSPWQVHSITYHTDTTLVLSTNGDGFGIFNTANGKYSRIEASKGEGLHDIFQTAFIGQRLLAGICPGGFFIYDTQTKKLRFKADNKDYNAILVERDKHIWLGSQDGLQLWDSSMKRLRSFYTTDGLINNYIQSIIQVADGSLWVSTSGGLTQIRTVTDADGHKRYLFSGFNRLDGVIANEFWDRSVYLDASGNIYWGGTDGFNILPVGRAPAPKLKNKPLFVSFYLFNKEVERGVDYEGNVILKDALLRTQEITLEHDQDFFSLEFSALNYVNPQQTYYRYQLIGVDQQEQELRSTDGNGRFNYTDIQPGTYTFRVRASDNSNNWQDNYAEVKVIVKAPFWRTGLAYVLYVVIVIGAITAGIWYYLGKKRAKLVLEQKEKLDEMKTAFFKNVNAEIREPLAHIIEPLDTILKQTEEGRLKLRLKEIQNNARDLQDLVGQLSKGVLSPVEADENELNMDVLLLNMRKLLDTQQERKQHAEEKSSKEVDNETLLTAADEKLLQRALAFVQTNMDDPAYTVESLSKDMGMDRTGLYRKLVHIIGKTPTTFIRSVRLKRAAQLLEEGSSVAEVADKVGFNTSSYLTKCFQEEFGMTPSNYVASLKRSQNLSN
ncbi:helix-turn-helix domain-containing protein [Mucilaginibacter daejeonensis]|uniref:helix-turn-helix domain-containing protein n=1 Tax=Mucilaginibacter daejeonensis TaxID=398049 RepID=UPI001D174E2D|nr:helix-turn-helix domain-containing protein [Mucilaginibacter daejeonensis]UEG54798.1 helix-turn-helix domain-containing protein [Mucilaginibacter daejeonensis]